MNDFEKDIKRVIVVNQRAEIKKDLQNLESKNFSKKSKNYWLVAASIAVIFSLGYFMFQSKPTNKELFAENFEPYRNIVHPIVRSDANNNNLKDLAFIAYENQEYVRASKLLYDLYKKEKNNAYLLYLGISYLQQNKIDKAILILEKQTDTIDKFNVKSYWFLALSYLKKNDNLKTKEYLKKVIEAKNFKEIEAKDLLDKL